VFGLRGSWLVSSVRQGLGLVAPIIAEGSGCFAQLATVWGRLIEIGAIADRLAGARFQVCIVCT
jgi:hypothetical protein